jgi:hypothetical protein
VIPNSNNHPWATFLNARTEAIVWMAKEMGRSDRKIAFALSMDTMQVTLIKMHFEDNVRKIKSTNSVDIGRYR